MALRYLSPIHNASRQIAAFLEARRPDRGVDATQAYALLYLRSYSPAPASELHRILEIKRSTLTGVIDRLEARGWLFRRPSGRDRRVIHIGLTEDGRAEADRIHETARRLEAEIEARVQPGDLEGFRAVISAIAAVTRLGGA
jgi:DNA-binding MarR family transcriptional regulator